MHYFPILPLKKTPQRPRFGATAAAVAWPSHSCSAAMPAGPGADVAD
jgi:hypothetical protein